MSPRQQAGSVAMICGAALALGGCLGRGSSDKDCFRKQEYQAAAGIEGMRIPPDLDTPAADGRLVIPEVAPPAEDAVGPGCLTEPPDYFGRPRD